MQPPPTPHTHSHCAPNSTLTAIELIRHVPAVRPPVTAILQRHTLIVAMAGKLSLRADSWDLGHCGGWKESEAAGTRWIGGVTGSTRDYVAVRDRWPVLGHSGRHSKHKEHLADTQGMKHVAMASSAPLIGPRTGDMPHTCSHHSTHVQATTRPSEDKGGGQCSLQAVPSQPAFVLLFLYPLRSLRTPLDLS